MRKYQYKRLPHKGRFSFVKKTINHEKIFINLLNNILKNSAFRLMPDGVDGISHGLQTGVLYAVVIEKKERRLTQKSVSFFFHPKDGKITVTFFRGALYKNEKASPPVVQKHVFELRKVTAQMFKKNITNWFAQKFHNYKIEVNFRTEFPLFNYKKTFYEWNVGMSVAWEIAKSIYEDEIKTKNQIEVKRFIDTYSTAQQILDNTMRCKIMAVETEEESSESASMLSAEICNRLHQLLLPPKKVIEPQNQNWLQRISDGFFGWFKIFRKQRI